MDLPLASDAGSVRRVMKLIYDDFPQDVSNDAGSGILGSQNGELRIVVARSRLGPPCGSGVFGAREPVSLVSKN